MLTVCLASARKICTIIWIFCSWVRISFMIAFKIIQDTCSCRTLLKKFLGWYQKYVIVCVKNFLKVCSNCWRKKHLSSGEWHNFLQFTSGNIVFYRNSEDEVCAPEKSPNSPKNSAWVIDRLKLCIDLGVYAEYFRYSNNTKLSSLTGHCACTHLVLSILSYCCPDIFKLFQSIFLATPSNLISMTDELALVHQAVVDRRIYKGGQTLLCSGSNLLLNTEFKGPPPVNITPLFLSLCDTFIWWHWNNVILWFRCLLPWREPVFKISPRIWGLRIMEDSTSILRHWKVW